MNKCLLIIDVQKGFLTKDTAHIPDRIRALLEREKFDHIAATRFINSTETPHYIYTHWDGMMDCESQQLAPYIESVSERIFDKGTNSCLTEEFLSYLDKNNISKLILVGIDTDCCVLKTAFDCFDRKIPFEVLTWCCASSGGKELHTFACEIMKRNLGEERVL